MFEEIARNIHSAAKKKQKMAMFHLQVLRHAHKLANVDPVEFCHQVNVPESYETEFRKMLNLASLMKEEGTALT